MINIKCQGEKTEAGHSLTIKEIQIIASAREEETISDVSRLLTIIDRLTGTCWTSNG